MSADLVNTTQGTSTSGAVSGSVFLGVPALTIALGRHVDITRDFYLSFSFGASIPFAPQSAVSLGGRVTDVVEVLPGGPEAFDNARGEIRRQVDEGAAEFRRFVIVLPSAQISFGFRL